MANIDSADLHIHLTAGGVWGNLCVEVFTITVPSGGAAIADVLRFGRGQAHSTPIRGTLYTSANEASSTLDVGYTTLDGTGSDTDVLANDLDIGTAGRFELSVNTPPVEIAEDFYWTATVAGAALAAATVLTLVAEYTFNGHD